MRCRTLEIVSLFEEMFNAELCNQLARKHKFIQRSSSKLEGSEFIKTLILFNNRPSEDSLNGLCLRINQFNPDANISASALCQRINKQASVELMKACLERILRVARHKLVKDHLCPEGTLSDFSNVYIQDSTVFELNKHVHKKYPGNKRGGKKGGSSCKAQAKIDLIHNFTSGVIEDVKIYEGKRPDQSLTEKILSILQPEDLVIRDLGYFKLETLRSISELGAYFLNRLPSHVKVYLSPDDKDSVDLAAHFEKHYKHQTTIEIKVWIGRERLETRLIAYRVPAEVEKERLRKAQQGAKNMKRTLSKSKLDLLKFSLFVTNTSVEKVPASLVGTIYRLRWEIELMFKQWKSLLHIDIVDGINPYRVECLILSRLCLVVLMSNLTATCMNLAVKCFKGELSPTKFIRYLIRDNRLVESLKVDLEAFEKSLMRDMGRRLLKDKRSRPTARKRVANKCGYYA